MSITAAIATSIARGEDTCGGEGLQDTHVGYWEDTKDKEYLNGNEVHAKDHAGGEVGRFLWRHCHSFVPNRIYTKIEDQYYM